MRSPGSREAEVRSNAPEVFSNGPDVTSPGPSVSSSVRRDSRPNNNEWDELLRSSGSRRPLEVHSKEGRDVCGISWAGETNYEIQDQITEGKAAPGPQVPQNLKYPRGREMRATMKE